MLSFFINFYRFFKIIIQGVKRDEDFKFLFFFIVILLIGSCIFYTKIENWSLIDALYFSVMTMATIGYGDLVPTCNLSKIFTIIYTFLSTGTFVALSAKFAMIMIDNHKRNNTQKKINK
ncbi:MAG: hypothetical protein CR967_01595 [Proteobacteria bacterium]|nr:MAG: hypothetical protein CR967_01595 [Pseudomonadota bacterium]